MPTNPTAAASRAADDLKLVADGLRSRGAHLAAAEAIISVADTLRAGGTPTLPSNTVLDIDASASEHIEFVATGLRRAKLDAAADLLDAIVANTTPPTPEPAQEPDPVPQPAVEELTDNDVDELFEELVADVDIADVDIDEDPDVPLSGRLRFDPPVTDRDAAIEAVRGTLDDAGDITYGDLCDNGGYLEVALENPNPGFPALHGAVAVSGAVFIGDTATSVQLALADVEGNYPDVNVHEAAEEILEQLREHGEPVNVPAAFRVTYTLHDGRFDDESIRPVLEFAETTLREFGTLIVVGVTHLDDRSVVDYGVLEPGNLSCEHLARGTTGWGGTVNVPAVGTVTAAIEL